MLSLHRLLNRCIWRSRRRIGRDPGELAHGGPAQGSGSAGGRVACTLLPYVPAFELGAALAEAEAPVRLNRRLCAEFCGLGGASNPRPG